MERKKKETYLSEEIKRSAFVFFSVVVGEMRKESATLREKWKEFVSEDEYHVGALCLI